MLPHRQRKGLMGGGSLPKLEVDDYYRGLPRGEKQLMRSAALDVRYLINGPHGVALRLESDDEKGISLFGEATYVENRIIAYDATDVFAAPAPAAPTPRGTTLTTRWCMS
jgi:hypothetical protein